MKKQVYISSQPVGKYQIIVSQNATSAEKYAADELAKYIQLTTGDALQIVTDISDPTPAEILVGRTNRREFTAKLKPDGYEIAAADGLLSLCGTNDRGTIYAVYAYLEQYVGWRFFTSDCEVLTEKASSCIYAGEYFTDEPVFDYRDPFKFDTRTPAIRAKMKANADCTCAAPIPEYMGGSIGFAGHGSHSLGAIFCRDKKLFEEHPEYFALRDGQRVQTQPCLTNPDVLRITVDTLLNTLRKNKRNYISVTQDDNLGYCTCDKCRAIDEAEGGPSGTLIHFVNAVAEEIEKEFPDVLVDTFAYTYTRQLPKHVRPRHNVMIRLCSIECCFRHPLSDTTCKNNVAFAKDLQDWSSICDKLHIWDYVTDFAYYVCPFPNLTILRENMRFYADHNVHGMMTQGVYNGKGCDFDELKCYLISKLLWNPYMTKAEYEYHMIDFLRGYYGSSWECIYKIIQMLDQSTAVNEHFDCYADPHDHYCELYKHMDEVEQITAKALELADNSTVYDRVRVVRAAMLFISINHDHDERKEAGGEIAAKLLADKQLFLSEYKALGLKCSEGRHFTEKVDINTFPEEWKHFK